MKRNVRRMVGLAGRVGVNGWMVERVGGGGSWVWIGDLRGSLLPARM